MRTEVRLKPTFWTRGSGKRLRGNSDAQVLAVYLMSSPHSTMVGIYYESLVTILHNTGLSDAAFRSALPLISEIAQYDEEESLVYLPGGAEHQIGETLATSDRKRKSILSQLKSYGKHHFVRAWVERYYEQYSLAHDGIQKPLRYPFEAPSIPLSTITNAPDPDPSPIPDPDPDPRSENGGCGDEPPLVASLPERARLWVKDPNLATLAYPNPHQWSEALELSQLVASTFKHDRADDLKPPSANGSLDSRVRILLERWSEGTDQARMRQAIRGAKQTEWIAAKPELQSLQTIFKDANAVDKYCRAAKGREPTPPSKANVERISAETKEARRKFREQKDL